MYIDFLKPYIPQLIALGIALFAYFYKQWVNHIDAYRKSLHELKTIVEINTDLLLSLGENDIISHELQYLPPFPYYDFGITDEAIRTVIVCANKYIARFKAGEYEIRLSAVQVMNNVHDALEVSLKMLNTISATHPVVYYLVVRLLRRKVNKDS